VGHEVSIDYTNISTEGVASQIARNLRAAILEGRLKVDDRLPTEEELADRFGVSRPTIREALKRLGAQNLIHTRRGPAGGSFVKKPSRQEMREQLAGMVSVLTSLGEFRLPEIVEARQELERVCCRIAATRRTDRQLAEMERELLYQQDTKITDVGFCASDVRFHRALVEATANSMLQFLTSAVIEVLQPVLNLVVYRFRERPLIVAQHREILLALRARDPRRAERALDAQMEYLRQKYAQATDARTHRHRRGAR
jgi:GntR family transcriptional regulator, transcriptional repressor for pyruvate dehydrogenase complex